jgi:Domain of unknown function (DUF3471)
VNFSKHWTDYNKNAGVSWGATSITTRVFACKSGVWKVVAFHETDTPNRTRQPSTGALDHLDDYVGRYRFGVNGDEGQLSIVRKGDRLFETWPGEEASEILPGKYDTFFSRGDGWVMTFIRNREGRVTRILYTHADGELEAKRLP